VAQAVDIDTETLRKAIKDEYKEVAEDPGKGFHFHTGRRLTKIVGYKDEWLNGVSEPAIASFAGPGNGSRSGECAPLATRVEPGLPLPDATSAFIEGGRKARGASGGPWGPRSSAELTRVPAGRWTALAPACASRQR
jgi:hypothetical protein